jgi:hypothetical protein
MTHGIVPFGAAGDNSGFLPGFFNRRANLVYAIGPRDHNDLGYGRRTRESVNRMFENGFTGDAFPDFIEPKPLAASGGDDNGSQHFNLR